MKRTIFFLILFSFIISMGYSGDWPEFAGVWMYTDNSIAAENMTVYEISPDAFYITVSISGADEESSCDETLELGILDYNENANHIKTKVLYAPEQEQVFNVAEGDILYWTYNNAEAGAMYFDYSKKNYPQKAETGPFDSSNHYKEQDWAEFAGTWYWVSDDGDNSETYVFYDQHEESDFAVLEIYAEDYQGDTESTGYALFEIPSYNEEDNTIRLTCLDSNDSLDKFEIGSIWYLTYKVNEEEAYFDLSKKGYPGKASSGPYYKIIE